MTQRQRREEKEMTSLYLKWVDVMEASLKSAVTTADQAHEHGVRSGLAMNDIFLRLWFPWTF